MLQIAPISRDEVDAYQDIRARLDALSGHINGVYSDADWTPVRYVNKQLSAGRTGRPLPRRAHRPGNARCATA